MRFNSETAEIFVPNGLPEEQALMRTTHLAVGAHQDDLEIMAATPILQCFQSEEECFVGVVMADGRGSPRVGFYQDYTDEEMRLVRISEQKKAAVIGEYAALVLLDYPSKAIKDGSNETAVEDLANILGIARPRVIYTHNLADKHDTHVGVALKVIAAIRSLPREQRPDKLYGCEVWRDLDWMVDSDKVLLDLSTHESLQAALLGVFDSQISGGKRYDLGTLGRRRANATYFESHGVDTSLGLSFAMDLTAMVLDPDLDVQTFIQGYVERFAQDVVDRLKRLS
jgi:LmbE family N-acetylglucosaminyl deacetylase